MDNEQISKKEILELTGISYGQLYRWKRKNLIPEDWFIKKSSFTGQETYFPREKILERISKIKDMKDDLSLDDIAERFSPQLADVLLTKQELLEKKIVSQMSVDIYETIHGETKVFSFDKILYVALLENCLQSGEVGLEEGKIILETLEENYKSFEGKRCEIILVRKFGIAVCLFLSLPNELKLEKGARLATRLDVSKAIEELKIQI